MQAWGWVRKSCLICLHVSLVYSKTTFEKERAPTLGVRRDCGCIHPGAAGESGNTNIWVVGPSKEGVTEAGATPAVWPAMATSSRETCLTVHSGRTALGVGRRLQKRRTWRPWLGLPVGREGSTVLGSEQEGTVDPEPGVARICHVLTTWLWLPPSP